MTLDNLNDVHCYSLPVGYKYVYFKSNADIADWINIHISTGELASKSKAEEYFHQFYDKFYKQLSKRYMFVVNESNEKMRLRHCRQQMSMDISVLLTGLQ